MTFIFMMIDLYDYISNTTQCVHMLQIVTV